MVRAVPFADARKIQESVCRCMLLEELGSKLQGRQVGRLVLARFWREKGGKLTTLLPLLPPFASLLKSIDVFTLSALTSSLTSSHVSFVFSKTFPLRVSASGTFSSFDNR